MGPNALPRTRNANVPLMTGIAPSASTFSQLEISILPAVTARRIPNPYAGKDHVRIMKWFLHKVFPWNFSNRWHIGDALAHSVRQGDTIIETEPAVFRFSTDQRVSEGRPQTISIPIYCHADPRNTGAPRYKTIGGKDEIHISNHTQR